jgi:hypothetical protein
MHKRFFTVFVFIILHSLVFSINLDLRLGMGVRDISSNPAYDIYRKTIADFIEGNTVNNRDIRTSNFPAGFSLGVIRKKITYNIHYTYTRHDFSCTWGGPESKSRRHELLIGAKYRLLPYLLIQSSIGGAREIVGFKDSLLHSNYVYSGDIVKTTDNLKFLLISAGPSLGYDFNKTAIGLDFIIRVPYLLSFSRKGTTIKDRGTNKAVKFENPRTFGLEFSWRINFAYFVNLKIGKKPRKKTDKK